MEADIVDEIIDLGGPDVIEVRFSLFSPLPLPSLSPSPSPTFLSLSIVVHQS